MLQRKDQSIHKLASELNDTRADKDQLEKLFDGSQLENQKCLQQINDFREHVRTLEAALIRINGPGWREEFSIPPTPGPRSLATPIPNIGILQKNRFPFGFTGAEVKAVSEADSLDDSIEEVVDSMRRYANGSKVANRNEPAQLNRIRSPLMEQLDDHTLSSSISDDDGDIKEGGPGPVPLHDGQTPVAIPIFPTTPDLQPIISLISSLHATSHAQSSELVSAILDNHDQKLALDHAEREQNRQTVVQQVQDAQAEVARAWEDMRQQDDVREHNLKRLLEEAIECLQRFDGGVPNALSGAMPEATSV
ncbi:hypothetical protein FFLO_04172 [Filobasidium floriforme]|uniref:Uncharacterized protein n=1 Tax=Filobasidium floriforme TaxID=5210 RepID=A0A8K0NQ46_9TREE|nr:hypothetical protein FFLO_04172 [Filobasidium floriforme]